MKGTLVNLNVIKDHLDNDPRVEEWQLVIKKRNDDECDVDEMHLNLALVKNVEDGDHDRIVDELGNGILRACEVRMNTTRILPLDQVLDLLGMETQLKEKRIVDLRGQTTSQPREPVKHGR